MYTTRPYAKLLSILYINKIQTGSVYYKASSKLTEAAFLCIVCKFIAIYMQLYAICVIFSAKSPVI